MYKSYTKLRVLEEWEKETKRDKKEGKERGKKKAKRKESKAGTATWMCNLNEVNLEGKERDKHLQDENENGNRKENGWETKEEEGKAVEAENAKGKEGSKKNLKLEKDICVSPYKVEMRWTV
jgi:hypothetical protein